MTAPTITLQPANIVVAPFQRGVFDIAASTSGGALSYQWKANIDGSGFVDIGGETALTYITPVANAGDNPILYKCTVTDSNGSIDSNVVMVQAVRTSRYGGIINRDVEASEIIALIDVGGCRTLTLAFALTGHALTAFTVEYQLYGSGLWIPMVSVAGDFTTPNYPVKKASGSLVTAAASTTQWLILDVEGFSAARIKAAGVGSVINGGFRAG